MFYQKNCNKKELKYGVIDENINCDNHNNKIDEKNVNYNTKYANNNKTIKKNYEKKRLQKKRNQTVNKGKRKGKKEEKEEKEEVNTDEELDIDKTIKYNDSVINIIKKFLKSKDKIVFFDEIHQGGGSNSMQDSTIRFFYDKTISNYYPLFVMVTATYTKPLGRYSNKPYLDNKETKLIEWTYKMIMDMKQFTLDYVTYIDEKNENEQIVDAKYLIDINEPEFKYKMDKLKEITIEYNKNGKTCEEIALEYRNYPELIYLLPTLKEEFFQTKEGENTPKTMKDLFELNKSDNTNVEFLYYEDVNRFLSYIYKTVYNELLFQRYGFVANGSGKNHSQLWFMPTTMKDTSKKGNKNKTEETKVDSTIIAPLLSNLAKMIVEHDNYKNFNVCVIHSIKSGERTEYISKKDTENLDIEDVNRRRVYFKCIDSSNVKKCIIDIENKSRENDEVKRGKSLIILTAQRLRLGISLPCVDVAIHMDNIKSYDIIYQSMFRVLTERAGKKRGYFVDMILDRAIQFFYKYTKVQKHIKMDEEGKMTTNDITKSLSMFDVGCINSSIYDSTDIVVNSYEDISKKFKIDSEENFKKYEKELIKNNEENDIFDKQQIEKQPRVKVVPPPPLEDIKRQTMINFL